LLQKSTLTADAAQRAAKILLGSLQKMRQEAHFHSLWVTITESAGALNLNVPEVPRRRKPPLRIDDGAEPTSYQSPEAFYRSIFFAFLDCTINFVRERFDQEAFDIYICAERLLLQAANNETCSTDSSLAKVTEHFDSDIDKDRLLIQLKMLPSAFSVGGRQNIKVQTIDDVVNALISLGDARLMFSEVNILVRLLLTMPVTSATAERSFSALRRLKTYTRSTMSAARLNHVAVLHIHKDITANLDPCEVLKEFVAGVESRRVMFGPL
jgi:hAT family C-terminal dimerisation region